MGLNNVLLTSRLMGCRQRAGFYFSVNAQIVLALNSKRQ